MKPGASRSVGNDFTTVTSGHKLSLLYKITAVVLNYTVAVMEQLTKNSIWWFILIGQKTKENDYLEV